MTTYGMINASLLPEFCYTLERERGAFVPCKGCNALSHRVGLLPDLLGKEEMPEPTNKVRKFAASVAENNEPLCGDDWNTREWEK